MNTSDNSTNSDTTLFSPEIEQVLRQLPSVEAVQEVDTWLESHDADVSFWATLPSEDVRGMTEWVWSNTRVFVGMALAGLMCAAVGLFFGTTPLSSFSQDPFVAVFFSVLASLVGIGFFSLVLFAPLSKLWNTVFFVRQANRVLGRLRDIGPDELDGFYNQVDHHPAACQYIHDVKEHRTIVAQDLRIAKQLVTEQLALKQGRALTV